jgi:hypothetical protein
MGEWAMPGPRTTINLIIVNILLPLDLIWLALHPSPPTSSHAKYPARTTHGPRGLTARIDRALALIPAADVSLEQLLSWSSRRCSPARLPRRCG